MKGKEVVRATFVFSIAAFMIGTMIYVVILDSMGKAGKIEEVMRVYGMNDQERNLHGYLKSANAHNAYDVVQVVKMCQSNSSITSSHLCVMPDGITVKDTLDARFGSGN